MSITSEESRMSLFATLPQRPISLTADENSYLDGAFGAADEGDNPPPPRRMRAPQAKPSQTPVKPLVPVVIATNEEKDVELMDITGMITTFWKDDVPVTEESGGVLIDMPDVMGPEIEEETAQLEDDEEVPELFLDGDYLATEEGVAPLEEVEEAVEVDPEEGIDPDQWLDGPAEGEDVELDTPESIAQASKRVFMENLGSTDAACMEFALRNWGMIQDSISPPPPPEPPAVPEPVEVLVEEETYLDGEYGAESEKPALLIHYEGEYDGQCDGIDLMMALPVEEEAV